MSINEIIQVGTRIKILRKSKGISQKDFAKEVGIAYSTYSNYENNNREPNREQLEKISGVLGVPILQLLGVSVDESLKPLDNEIKYLNYLLSLGYQYVDHFVDNEYGFDRCIHIINENIDIPLTKKEYEQLEEYIKADIETEIYKLRKKKNL